MRSSERTALVIRLTIIGLLILLQLVWMGILVTSLVRYTVTMNVIMMVLSLGIILYLLDKNASPAYRLSWIILVAVFPIFGSLFYLFAGNKRPLKEMTQRINRQIRHHQPDRLDIPDGLPQLKDRDPRLAAIAQYVNDYADRPVMASDQVKYYPNGEAMMPDLLRDLEAAESHIFLEFFIIEYGVMFDQIFDILKRKAQAGVEVRLIYDDFGCLLRLPEGFVEQMAQYGIKALKFNPVRPIVSLVYNTRDHRKYIIIDHKIAYTGGLNIADEYINVKERFGYWKDTMVKIEGGPVWNLAQSFLILWNAYIPEEVDFNQFNNAEEFLKERTLLESQKIKGFVQPFSDSPLDNEPMGENVYREILNAAEDYVYIFTPYLVISYELQTAMTLAAKRGVDVRLMTPGIPDKKMVYRMTRSYYRPLIEGGVKIYEYSPGFLHAKSFVSDDRIAIVGTINLDYRSLYLHFETATLLYYHPEIQEIKKDFLNAQAESELIRGKHLRRSFKGKLIDSLLRLLAPFV